MACPSNYHNFTGLEPKIYFACPLKQLLLPWPKFALGGKMKKKYSFRRGPYEKKQNEAQKIGEFLEIKFPNGIPDPETLVKISKNKQTPTHKYFDWNNTTAAAKYRRMQAANLIAALYVETIDGDNTRAYNNVYLAEVKHGAYVATAKVAEDKELWSQVVEQARRELIFWKTKYQQYRTHFSAIFDAIDEVTDLTKGVSNGKVKNNRTTNTRAKDNHPSD